MAELLGDLTTSSVEWRRIRELLQRRNDAELFRARVAIGRTLGLKGMVEGTRRTRVALLGMRGAGKSTLGRRLAEDWGFVFVDLSDQIGRLSGCDESEVESLYGGAAYRRLERQAFNEAIQSEPRLVLELPGSVSASPLTLSSVLAFCTSVWLEASAEDLLLRVRARRGHRASFLDAEALGDLQRTLARCADSFSQADLSHDTSAQALEKTYETLRARLEGMLDI